MEHLEIMQQVEFSPVKQVRKKLIASENMVAELVCYEPGQATVPHLHPRQDEIFYVIEGKGTIVVGEENVPVTAGSVVFGPLGVRHGRCRRSASTDVHERARNYGCSRLSDPKVSA